jgi:hypothetical protein
MPTKYASLLSYMMGQYRSGMIIQENVAYASGGFRLLSVYFGEELLELIL